MLRKLSTIVLLSCVLAAFSVPARAQMSDDAVVEYVKNGMASGKSQNDMAKELLARGVTQAQAERIKAKYEQEQASQTAAARVAGVQERQRRVNDGLLETEAGDMDAVSMEVAAPGAKTVFGRDIFRNGNLTIDYGAGCAFLDGQELKLTPTEYRLLCLLARDAGKVLTHTYLTDQIWGSSWESDMASLRVHMATLRKKLEKNQTTQYIQTHIGIGYRMLKVE